MWKMLKPTSKQRMKNLKISERPLYVYPSEWQQLEVWMIPNVDMDVRNKKKKNNAVLRAM